MEITNIHSRVFPYSLEQVGSWVEWLWSGTDKDAFPRDLVPNFRRNPEGVDPLALVPGVTRLGHGPTRFRFDEWDGQRWRVTVVSTRVSGWHGFDLVPEAGGTRLTHTLAVGVGGWFWFEWLLMIRPLHDWVLEALFDRLGTALATGRVPVKTERPLPWYCRLLFRSWGWLKVLRLTRRW